MNTSKQSTDTILMIPPSDQCKYVKLIDNKFYLGAHPNFNKIKIEFDILVKLLKNNGVKIIVSSPSTNMGADSMFSNNWISTHEQYISLYPMKYNIRRAEYRQDVINLINSYFKKRKKIYDLRRYVNENKFLEGTGSLVLDRINKVAYCCISERSNIELAQMWSDSFKYKLVTFRAYDKNKFPIFHTNMMMSIGTNFALVCMESIESQYREQVNEMLERSNKSIIYISLDQVREYCGNILELRNGEGDLILVVSSRALSAFTKSQLDILQNHLNLKVISSDISSIENSLGGGIRCMMTEIFIE